MLGSSILGFHTRFHCNNFLDTVDRFLEARVDRETNGVRTGASVPLVQALSDLDRLAVVRARRRAAGDGMRRMRCATVMASRPTRSSAWASIGSTTPRASWNAFSRSSVCSNWSPHGRASFTLRADRAPRARRAYREYRHFACEDVRDEAHASTRASGADGYQPIILRLETRRIRTQSTATYRGAEVCFVSSLHDGMNLVAKEFVAARDDEQGVLILSEFTGASRELAEALIVNPYNMPTSLRRGTARRADHARRRTARPHAQHAIPESRNSTSTAGPGACCSTRRSCAGAPAYCDHRHGRFLTASDSCAAFGKWRHDRRQSAGGRRAHTRIRERLGFVPRRGRHAARISRCTQTR